MDVPEFSLMAQYFSEESVRGVMVQVNVNEQVFAFNNPISNIDKDGRIAARN